MLSSLGKTPSVARPMRNLNSTSVHTAHDELEEVRDTYSNSIGELCRLGRHIALLQHRVPIKLNSPNPVTLSPPTIRQDSPFREKCRIDRFIGASEKGHDAGLTTISIGKLLSGDESTHDQLFRASKGLRSSPPDLIDHVRCL